MSQGKFFFLLTSILGSDSGHTSSQMSILASEREQESVAVDGRTTSYKDRAHLQHLQTAAVAQQISKQWHILHTATVSNLKDQF